MTYSRPKGTADIWGKDIAAWRRVEDAIRALCRAFCIDEIRTPMYEYEELFRRGIGETTDVVQKEMFTFTDAGGRDYALRPEGTAGVVRAFIENGMSSLSMPQKLYYIMPVFRAEKPQKGRYRQHHQFGIEYIGAYNPECDAEVISVARELLFKLGIEDVELHINSIGWPECRAKYNNAFKTFLGKNIDKLCPTCRERFEKNPLRVLDCKNESCKALMAGAPTSVDTLDKECRAHFMGVLAALEALGIDYIVDPFLVRGLDYYTRTVFEFKSTSLGAQDTVCGGGRYDGLIAECGGQDTASVGFGMGIERLLLIMEEKGLIKAQTDETGPVFIGYIGYSGKNAGARLALELRRVGIPCEYDIMERGVKAQMKRADKLNAAYSIIIGDDEVETGRVKIKDMRTGEAVEKGIDDVITYFKENN
ncbi:MAG: histidine--tRNA ligase [Clostridiales bacterium]|jgi:histidyl-tRNA synthetase|nr:histidine--tRNA ligase [Clostridiales bacterium]